MAKADALVFDLGNVLVGIEWDTAFDYWSRESGVPHARLKERFRFDDAYAAHERNEISGPEYFSHLRSILGVTLTDDHIKNGWTSLGFAPLEGVPELLRELAPLLPIYGLTNTNATHHACWEPRNREVLAPLARMFCSHEMAMRKPSAEMFDLVAREIGVAPGRIAFFDDLQENVEGARLAGWQGFLVNGVEGLRRVLSEDLQVLIACKENGA